LFPQAKPEQAHAEGGIDRSFANAPEERQAFQLVNSDGRAQHNERDTQGG
jgi:hypothetical protein